MPWDAVIIHIGRLNPEGSGQWLSDDPSLGLSSNENQLSCGT